MKKTFLKFELNFFRFWKFWSYHQREMGKFEQKILFWKFEIWNEKKMKFSFLKFEMKISVWNLKKKFAISLEGNEKKLKWRITYFIYATEIKLSITPLYHLCVPPYTTGTSCGSIINLSRKILSYWSFSNSGIWWYGPPKKSLRIQAVSSVVGQSNL
jgi:hypothetical protein